MKTKNTSAFQNVLRRELERITQNWALLFLTIIGPALSIFLIVWIFSAGVPRDLPIAVVDLDHSTLSRKLTSMVDASATVEVHRKYLSLYEAKKAIESGEVDAALYIPKGAERDIFKGLSTTTALYLNNMNVVKGGLINSAVRKSIGTLSAGIKLQLQLKSGFRQEQAISRIMPVMLRSVLLFNPFTSYSYYLTVSLLFICLIIFTLLGTIYAVGDELYKGSGTHWIRIADKNYFVAIVGKLLPYTTAYFIYALIIDLVLFNTIGVPIRGHVSSILLGELLLILSYQAMAIFLLAITTNMRLSLSLGSGYTMLAITFCGLTFPVFGMPAIAQAIAAIFPFTYWMKILMGQSLRGEALVNSIIPMYSLLVFVFFGLLFLPRLMHSMLNRKRWGKM